MKILNHFIPTEILHTLGFVFGLIMLCLSVFYFINKKRSTKLTQELFLRTRSWAFLAAGIATVVVSPKIIGTLIIAYVSFAAFREMASISGFRTADRNALFAAYCSIPIQYLLIYHNMSALYFAFIPVIMFTVLPFFLIAKGDTKGIGKSMALIPAILMMCVFMISHLAMLFGIEESTLPAGPGGLILFLVALTALNDVFQYIWGKLLGRKKIIPAISPNKTRAGFIGGVLSTGAIAAALNFLTPLSLQEAVLTGFAIGIAGFAGDILISAIKRDLNLKDTDDVIPGHGGIMDRMDSLVLTAPVFYYLLTYFLSVEVEIIQKAEFAMAEVLTQVHYKYNLVW